MRSRGAAPAAASAKGATVARIGHGRPSADATRPLERGRGERERADHRERDLHAGVDDLHAAAEAP